ncbi:hypothetical protein [Chitinophaga sp. YIM B06452]|uniref:hypothetical protein n=1 Tax=Chitinophaga sp. YIM B06452 TaxID=3082158 RepID=UPI0031FEADFC
MNITPATEDLLNDDDYNLQRFRRQLVPLWMKILTILMLLTAIALAVFFVISQIRVEWGILRRSVYSWQEVLMLALLVNYVLFGVTAWAVLREKRWAVNFGLANIGLGVLITGYVVVDVTRGVIRGSFVFGVPEAVLLFVFTLLCIYLYKLFRIRREWGYRQSKITGKI